MKIIYQQLYRNAISAEANINKTTVFMHHGMGCTVHFNAKIGVNCRIFQNVTIGAKWTNQNRDIQVPVIADNVLIVAGAVILGNVKIGQGSIIGDNAVVTKDVPPYCISTGIPTKYRVIKKD